MKCLALDQSACVSPDLVARDILVPGRPSDEIAVPDASAVAPAAIGASEAHGVGTGSGTLALTPEAADVVIGSDLVLTDSAVAQLWSVSG